VSKLGAPEDRRVGCEINVIIAQHICDYIRIRARERRTIFVKAHCKNPRVVYEDSILLGWCC
jgi:hypothetical protein